jgi:hypothetical protein
MLQAQEMLIALHRLAAYECRIGAGDLRIDILQYAYPLRHINCMRARQSDDSRLQALTTVEQSLQHQVRAKVTHLPALLLHGVGPGQYAEFMVFPGWAGTQE